MDQNDHNSKEDTPQFLQDLKRKDSGYRLPNDYFAKLQANVLDQVIEKESVRKIAFFDNLKSWYQMTVTPQYRYVGIAALALLTVFIVTKDNTTGIHHSFTSLHDADLEYFIENEIDDINHLELMATISSEEFNINDIPILSHDSWNTTPDQYIEDLNNTTLIDFTIED